MPYDGPQVLALSIPPSDIQRLSIRPLKWLRFVTFAVCGAHGDLSAAPDGPAVDYDSISHTDVAEAYYYTPQGNCNLVDYTAVYHRVTSSEQTPRRSHFRADVMERDGPFCVFTGYPETIYDAAHIVPRSKGDEYISVVFRDRLHLYDPPDLEMCGINSVENGILLAKHLHALFGHAHVAFLKTPNFALDTVDIPPVEEDPMPPSRITLQHLVPPVEHQPIPACDVRFVGTGMSPPPDILLDYMYGAAAYQHWGARQGIEEAMHHRFSEHYKSIPMPPPSPTSSDPSNPSSESDDSRDGDYEPRTPPRQRHHRPDMSAGMLRAMDNVLALSMLLQGTTPDAMATEKPRQEEEEEFRAQEASQVKVLEWMQRSDVPSCPANSRQHWTSLASTSTFPH